MENGKALIVPLMMLGVAYKWHESMADGLRIDLNGFVFVALIPGLALHGNLLRYAQAAIKMPADPLMAEMGTPMGV